ncbi:TetR/AcrR family transcriptional regulator [Chitinophaga silvatica]|uniref:TetR/AcrR family transcriptional regulator n=1 Tax=Chitinophaga silvatica TaxID=2282649 RepID=A0A3E1Y990_9BACT|nr:TetR/AcrR family transcriptional regulator [Chitinophaga silvatica]RFS21921.1 TetR/AcrR family transcriptional regulator [Chitinophaga silvatica]
MRPKNLEKEQAIKSVALQLIAEEGLENLSMQKLAKAANISPRTIYLKYADKDDLLIKLYIEEVLGAYEAAITEGLHDNMTFEEGVKHIWMKSFEYYKTNQPAFALMLYGKSSPLLNKAFQEMNIKEGQYFAPIHQFLELQVKKGKIKDFPFTVQRALLFAPLTDLINEYFEHINRSGQPVTPQILMAACETVIDGLLKK